MFFNDKSSLQSILALLLTFAMSSFSQAEEIRMISDIAYGKSGAQTMDVYYPSVKKQDSPVIFMVHGGAWRIGDKASKAVVKNKVAHWVPKGFVFISVNYRMLPEVRPVEQAEDVKKALRFSQKNAYKWGGSPSKFILMGHSAGAHLISLISVRYDTVIEPWLGTIALDSAAYDVEKIMSVKSPPRFYKKAFGKNPAYWKKASPINGLSSKSPPFLAVCSSKRKDDSCLQAKSFIDKAKQFNSHAQLLPIALSHREVNVRLGADYCYTQSVEKFMKKLDLNVESLLKNQSTSRLRRKAQQDCFGY